MTSPEQQFADLLAAEPSRPFVTYYDEATGERAELSVKSLANWAAKTHFLLIDELGLGAGDRAYIALPMHWISIAPILGCLMAGLTISDDPAGAEVAFVEPNTAESAAGIADVYAVAPASAAVGFGDAPPAGTSDYVRAVRPQADAWGTVRFGAGPDDLGVGARSRSDLVAAARDRAAALGVEPGARVLATRPWRGAADWLDAVFLPLAARGSVVYVVNTDDEAILQRRVEQERVTVRI
jgi:uncharacterized protein (TIGR03089 family)